MFEEVNLKTRELFNALRKLEDEQGINTESTIANIDDLIENLIDQAKLVET